MKKLKLAILTIAPILLVIGVFHIYHSANLFAQVENKTVKNIKRISDETNSDKNTNNVQIALASNNTTSPNIQLTNLQPNQTITRNFTIEGRTKGTWYFEGDFPVVIKTTDGDVIDTFIAQGQGDTMTEDFVPFEVTVDLFDFAGNKAVIEFQKDNPSGRPELDESISIPVNLALTGKGGF